MAARILTFLFWVVPLNCSLSRRSIVPYPRLHALEIIGSVISTLEGNNDFWFIFSFYHGLIRVTTLKTFFMRPSLAMST